MSHSMSLLIVGIYTVEIIHCIPFFWYLEQMKDGKNEDITLDVNVAHGWRTEGLLVLFGEVAFAIRLLFFVAILVGVTGCFLVTLDSFSLVVCCAWLCVFVS